MLTPSSPHPQLAVRQNADVGRIIGSIVLLVIKPLTACSHRGRMDRAPLLTSFQRIRLLQACRARENQMRRDTDRLGPCTLFLLFPGAPRVTQSATNIDSHRLSCTQRAPSRQPAAADHWRPFAVDPGRNERADVCRVKPTIARMLQRKPSW